LVPVSSSNFFKAGMSVLLLAACEIIVPNILHLVDSWLFSQLNTGSKEGDQAKMETLGPYAKAFGTIISHAAKRRTDIPALKKLLEETGTKLYRGTGLTKNELQQYKDLVGKCRGKRDTANMMTMTGFISTSIQIRCRKVCLVQRQNWPRSHFVRNYVEERL
jgi:hypothetical protein